MGVGYYCWPDSDIFAHEWGKTSYNGKYAIVTFKINCPVDKLFDLACNVAHHVKFEEYKKLAIKSFEDIYIKRKDNKKLQEIRKRGITVAEIFWMLRKLKNDDIFGYKVVKVSDSNSRQTGSMYFSKRKEAITTFPRVQLVVYPEARSYIENVEIHHFSTE